MICRLGGCGLGYSGYSSDLAGESPVTTRSAINGSGQECPLYTVQLRGERSYHFAGLE